MMFSMRLTFPLSLKGLSILTTFWMIRVRHNPLVNDEPALNGSCVRLCYSHCSTPYIY